MCAIALGGVASIPPDAAAAPAATWHVAKLLNIHQFRNLIGLTATGASDAWAFGDGARHPAVLHWNGSTWTGSTLPGAFARPENASSTGPKNVWASGERCNEGPPSPPGFFGYVSRWNGQAWATTKFRNMRFCPGSVVTVGPREGWLFGFYGNTRSTLALHFTGGRWRLSTLGSIGQILAATGVSARDVWAFASGSRGRSLAVHWNGQSWRSVSLPDLHLATGQHLDLVDARAVSATKVWLAAEITPIRVPVLLQWNGKGWQRIPVPGHSRLTNIATDGHGGVWLLGVTSAGVYWFLHYSQGKWTIQHVPVAGIPGAPANAAFNMYALAGVPGTTSVWATGDVFYSDASNHQHAYTVIFKFGT
jgi:hypothetical protein